jgi:hypothetical protein
MGGIMNTHKLADAMKGRVIYLLALVILIQTIYPITYETHVGFLLAYQFLYALLLVTGILVARENPLLMWVLIGLGITWLGVSGYYAFNPTQIWSLMAAYGVLIVFQGMVVLTLLIFIFTAQVITRDILFASVAVYLLIGAVFTPTFGIVETLTFAASDGQMHAFNDGVTGAGEVIPWQTFVYYSYETLTTLGYGDIQPLTMWARSVVSVEAVIGVLYTTIIIARLVGLYSSSPQTDVA